MKVALVGDGAAARAQFEEFFAAHARDLSRLAYLVCGEHHAADDIVAEALSSAWQHWDRVCRSDRPLAYVRRMVVNIAVSHVRRNVRDRRVVLRLTGLPGHPAVDVDSAAVLDVRAALHELPPRRRACIVLRYAFDLSEEDVARTLGISVGTVKSQTAKAAAQLRGLLSSDAAAAGAPGAADGFARRDALAEGGLT